MRNLSAFIQVSLDGFFADESGGIGWAQKAPDDGEWNDFVAGNAKGGGALLLGRLTYEMMARFWPTPAALQTMPAVAERMNALPKIVFSRTLGRAAWNNTTLLAGDPVAEVRQLKQAPGPGLATLGSGSIVAQLAQAGLIDDLQVVVNPVVLGKGKPLFGAVAHALALKLTASRAFANGSVALHYAPAPVLRE